MYFKESYFEEEIREGFFVHPMMKRVWAAQLEVLEELDRICKKYNIMYFAEWGTLLGAIRHHGFIPWDDDMDIGMRRKDYWKFLDVAKDELKDPFILLNSVSEKRFLEAMARVTNGLRPRYDAYFLNRFHGCPYYCGIDIFPCDNIPDDDKEQEIFALMFGLVNSTGNEWDGGKISQDEKRERVSQIEKLIGKEICLPNDMTMNQYFIHLSEQIASMFYLDKTRYVGQANLFAQYRTKIPVELFESTIDVPFENTFIPVPIGYDKILKIKYGNDYMVPSYKGGAHDYPFFREQQDLLFDFWLKKYGEIPSIFRF